MARRLLVVPQIGEVVLAKRRGSTNIRLSITQAGQVRVGLPHWAPYEAGLLFVKSHREWIQKQLLVHAPRHLTNGSRIGQSHQLLFTKMPAKNGLADIRITPTTVEIKTDEDPLSSEIQTKSVKACERALKQEAEVLLPKRVESISQVHRLPYSNVRIRKLTSRWGSCSSKKDITLSYFLVQLPWELVDYVILHELVHTKFHNHSREFWTFMEASLPDLRNLRKQIKAYKPRVEPH